MTIRLRSIATLFLLAVGSLAAHGADVPPAAAKAAAAQNQTSTCNNVETQCFDCQGNLMSTKDPKAPGVDHCNTFSSNHGSLIDELSFAHLHTAVDVMDGQIVSGCSTCGGGSTGASVRDAAGLIPAQMVRTHRFRDMTQHSSFGPGVYGSYDNSLRIARTPGGPWQVILTDPSLKAPMIFTDSGNGIFTGAGWNLIRGLQFFTGAAGTGMAVADPSLAQSGVLTSFTGNRFFFDVFNPYGTTPSPWKSGDIGGSISHGAYGFANNVFTISASGSDIWNTSDQQGYTYQAFSGDLTIVAQVTSLSTYRGLAADGSDQWAKAGVMIRESLDANAKVVNCFITPGNGAVVQSRSAAGASMVHNASIGGVVAPYWVRLQRVGDVMTGSISTDGSNWQTITSVTVPMNQVVFAGLSLTSHNDGVLSVANYANVSTTGSAVAPASWPTPTTAPYVAGSLAGRLSSILDRNGYGITVTYQSFTPAQLQQSPDLAWEINTVTDAHGRKLTMHYGAQQVSGRWAVSSIDTPNGSHIQYTYTNGLLSGVTYPDGTSSTFTYTPDSASQCINVGYDDAGSDGIHRRKQVFLTNTFSAAVDTTNPYQVFNQASSLVRIILNGSGEVTYMNYSKPGLVSQHYEGTGRVKQISKLGAAIKAEYFTTWTFDPATGFSGTLDSNSLLMQFADDNMYRQGTPSQSTAEDGVVMTYGADPDGITNRLTYSDGTQELYTYNTFKEITRYEDRLHRVTLYTYDTQGNETLKEVGIVYNGMADVHQAEYATFQKQYYPAGDANQFLLKASIDANGNMTSYTYTPVASDGSNHFVKSVTTPNDAGTGTIVASTATYDAVGRLASSADALGRTASYTYDSRDRLVRTTYSDGSTEIVAYSTSSADHNLVSQRKDRQGTVTEYFYDLAGRCTVTRVGAVTMSSDGSTLTPTDPTQRASQSLQTQVLRAYLYGTDLEASHWDNGILSAGDLATGTNVTVTAAGVASGNLTATGYDYMQRPITSSRYPTATQALTTTRIYTNNLLSQVVDPYGRSSYLVYRPVDARLVRQVQGLIPADTVGNAATAATIARDTSTNPKFVVSDYQLDAEGQQSGIVDPRNITSTMAYDSRGRLTSRIEAASDSSVAGRTDSLYDAQSNQIEIRSPRYFASSDSIGSGNARTTMAYTKRNLLRSRTAAPGVTGVAGTVAYTYYDDARVATSTDELGDIATTTWKVCCARVDAQVDPSVTDATGTFFGTRFLDYTNYGDQTHETVTRGTGIPAPGCCNQNPSDAQTLTEATMAYDVRHRQVARTQWFTALGAVDANNPPIAGQNGIAANLGLTTVMRYDDNLADSLGLSNASDPQSVAPYLGGLGLGANAAGSAMVTINPAGEPRWTIMDGLGRVVRVVDGNGHTTTTTYDTVDGTTTLVKTTVTDALGHAVSQYADAAGRVRIQEDQLLKRTTLGYDADGNLISQLDPTNVGQSCVYDSRNRKTDCTDTASPPVHTGWAYDANSNLVRSTDGLNNASTYAYDARDRKVSTTDRLLGVTQFQYDAHSNLLFLIDAQNAPTAYLYDPRNLLVSETYPPGQATPQSPNTPPLDRRTYTYDAARRLATRTDQALVVTSYAYDFISRLTSRQYSDGLGNDSFAYDLASRLTSAVSGRYATAVGRSYTDAGEKGGRLTSETQTVGGITGSVGYGYDAADRTTGITYPDASAVIRGYTNRNQLASAQLGTSTIASGIAYDDAGRRTSLPLGNGLVESRTYKPDGLVSTISEGSVVNYAYAYDANKRVTTETNSLFTAESEGYGYDTENRVTSWNRSSAETQNWQLSLVGDWNSTSRSGPNALSQTRSHSGVHEVTGILPSGGSNQPLAYDTKGNLKVDSSASQAYAWDDENRLITASRSDTGGTLGTYVYDALGRRLQKTAGLTMTTYVHDGAQVIAEYEAPAFVAQPIGSVSTPGSLGMAAGTVTLTGSGSDIWDVSDNFTYASQLLTGDGSATVRVTGLTNTDGWAKAGLMLRAGTAANAINAFIAYTPGNGVAFQTRNATGGSCTTTFTGSVPLPCWLRLVRTGSAVTGQRSTDGLSWTTVGSATVTLGSTANLGLGITAHNNALVATGTFTSYTTTGAVTSAGAQLLARRYVYGTYVDEPLALVNGSGTFYYASNRVYSVVALTNSSGAVTERYRYDTYGARTVLDASSNPVAGNVSAAANQTGFTGRYLDQETGLWYFRERYVNSGLGRFIGRDPLATLNSRQILSPLDIGDGAIGLPSAGMGYQNGMSLYGAYFVPEFADPTGMLSPEECTIVVWVGHSGIADQGADTARKDVEKHLKERENHPGPLEDPGRNQRELNTFRIGFINCLADEVNNQFKSDYPSNSLPGLPPMGGFGHGIKPGESFATQPKKRPDDFNFNAAIVTTIDAAMTEGKKMCCQCKNVTIKVHCADPYPGQAKPADFTDKCGKSLTGDCNYLTTSGADRSPGEGWQFGKWK